MDLSEAFVLQIRALQAMNPEAHQALLNWGLWSQDRYCIGPKDARPSMWHQFKPDENEDWGEPEADTPRTDAPVKAEGPEKRPYDEKMGVELDERIHGPGGLSEALRDILKVAYVRRDIHESQYPRAAGCSNEAFAERLEGALVFVGRFV